MGKDAVIVIDRVGGSVPDLKSCPQCSSAIPAAAPAGLCPTCSSRLADIATAQPDETPRVLDPESTGHYQPEPTDATAAELARQADNTASLRPASSGKSAVSPRQAPVVLGNLEVFEELGHGGMGVVYRARQRLANREVAVKVLSGASSSPPSALTKSS